MKASRALQEITKYLVGADRLKEAIELTILLTIDAYLNVEPIDSNPKVRFVLHVLLSGVEFLPLVDILPAGIASHITRGHKTDCKLPILSLTGSWDFRWVKVRRVVFLQNIDTINELSRQIGPVSVNCIISL